MQVDFKPEGYHTITPSLVCNDADKALEFYKKAFGAEEIIRYVGPDKKSIMHSRLQIGDAIFIVVDEFPQMNSVGPLKLGGTPVSFFVYFEDVDVAFDRAVKAGATVLMPLADMFWGDRWGLIADPFGHRWNLATRKQNLTPEQIQKAQDEMFKNSPCGSNK